jgi:NitT/TauT family transport system permease protein
MSDGNSPSSRSAPVDLRQEESLAPAQGAVPDVGGKAASPVATLMENTLRIWIYRVLIIIAVLVVWQAAIWNGVSQLLIPSPLNVLKTLWIGFFGSNGTFLRQTGVTLLEAGLGFLFGFILGLALGAAFAFVPTLRKVLYPYVAAIQTFPKIAIAPLLVIWVGYGISSKVIIATMLAFFPIMVNTAAGLTSVPQDEIDLFASFRASRWQEFWQLRWPRCLGYLFPAMETAVILSLLGAIAGEFVGASAGLGYLLLQKTYLGDIASMFAVLVVLGILGVVLSVVMASIRQRVLFWQQK